MRNRLLLWLLLGARLVLAAGSVQTTTTQLGTTNNWVITYQWTGDASTGTVPVTVGPSQCCQGYYVTQVVITPGSPAPTAGYAVQILDPAGLDFLNGQASALSATAAQSFSVSSSAPPLNGSVRLSVSGQSVASARGSVSVYLQKPGSFNAALGFGNGGGGGGGGLGVGNWLTLTNSPYYDIRKYVFTPITPSGSLTAGTQATVSIACPAGVDGRYLNSPLYIADAVGGTGETVAIQGGTCRGSGTGTVIFTPASTHAAGYSIQTATNGGQEAENDRYTNGGSLVLIPAGTYAQRGTIYLHSGAYVTGAGETTRLKASSCSLVFFQGANTNPAQGSSRIDVHGLLLDGQSCGGQNTLYGLYFPVQDPGWRQGVQGVTVSDLTCNNVMYCTWWERAKDISYQRAHLYANSTNVLWDGGNGDRFYRNFDITFRDIKSYPDCYYGNLSPCTSQSIGMANPPPTYNQVQTTALTAGQSATITFGTSCPAGPGGATLAAGNSLYLAGGGNSEYVKITGGTCTTGAATGTVIFTPAFAHSSSGWAFGPTAAPAAVVTAWKCVACLFDQVLLEGGVGFNYDASGNNPVSANNGTMPGVLVLGSSEGTHITNPNIVEYSGDGSHRAPGIGIYDGWFTSTGYHQANIENVGAQGYPNMPQDIQIGPGIIDQCLGPCIDIYSAAFANTWFSIHDMLFQGHLVAVADSAIRLGSLVKEASITNNKMYGQWERAIDVANASNVTISGNLISNKPWFGGALVPDTNGATHLSYASGAHFGAPPYNFSTTTGGAATNDTITIWPVYGGGLPQQLTLTNTCTTTGGTITPDDLNLCVTSAPTLYPTSLNGDGTVPANWNPGGAYYYQVGPANTITISGTGGTGTTPQKVTRSDGPNFNASMTGRAVLINGNYYKITKYIDANNVMVFPPLVGMTSGVLSWGAGGIGSTVTTLTTPAIANGQRYQSTLTVASGQTPRPWMVGRQITLQGSALSPGIQYYMVQSVSGSTMVLTPYFAPFGTSQSTSPTNIQAKQDYFTSPAVTGTASNVYFSFDGAGISLQAGTSDVTLSSNKIKALTGLGLFDAVSTTWSKEYTGNVSQDLFTNITQSLAQTLVPAVGTWMSCDDLNAIDPQTVPAGATVMCFNCAANTENPVTCSGGGQHPAYIKLSGTTHFWSTNP